MSILEMMKGADSGPGINLKMSHVFPLAILLQWKLKNITLSNSSARLWDQCMSIQKMYIGKKYGTG